MAGIVWHGWQTSLENAPQQVGIVFGRNLRKRADESPVKPDEGQAAEGNPAQPSSGEPEQQATGSSADEKAR